MAFSRTSPSALDRLPRRGNSSTTWRRVSFTILPQDTLHCFPRSTSVAYPPKIASFSSFITPSAQNFASHAPQLRQGGSRQLHHLPLRSTRSPVGLSLSKRRLRIIGVRIKGSYPWALLSQDLSSFADVWCTSGAKNIPKEIIDGFCHRYEISAKCITRPPWTYLKSLNVHGQMVSGRTVIESEI